MLSYMYVNAHNLSFAECLFLMNYDHSGREVDGEYSEGLLVTHNLIKKLHSGISDCAFFIARLKLKACPRRKWKI
jgi:hypothetical protein